MHEHAGLRHAATREPKTTGLSRAFAHDADLFVQSLLEAVEGIRRAPCPVVAPVAITDLLLDPPGVLVVLGSDLPSSETLPVLGLLGERRLGTSTRVLVPPTLARHAPVRAALTALGAWGTVRLRTARTCSDTLTIVTSEGLVAVQQSGSAVTSVEPGSLRTTLASVLESLWETGIALAMDGDTMLDDPRHAAVLKLLADGAKDDSAARTLDVSVRTYRRYVAHIMAGLGAASRFQAGARAARIGLVAG